MNPYTQNAVMSTEEFLHTSFLLIKKKVLRCQEIESKRKKDKLPLPLLKEKADINSKVLEALHLMIANLDYKNKEANELASIFNEIGLLFTKDDYEIILIILESFLNNPDEETTA